MALIHCPECGKEVSDRALGCPNCGFPMMNQINNPIMSNYSHIQPIQNTNNRSHYICPNCNSNNINTCGYCNNCGMPMGDASNSQIYRMNTHVGRMNAMNDKKSTIWASGRLTLCILSIIMALIIIYQSAIVFMGELHSESKTGEGTFGILIGYFIVIAGIVGIVGIVLKKPDIKLNCLVPAGFYMFSGFITIGTGTINIDLPIWGFAAWILGIVFVVCAVWYIDIYKQIRLLRKVFTVLDFTLAFMLGLHLYNVSTELSVGTMNLFIWCGVLQMLGTMQFKENIRSGFTIAAEFFYLFGIVSNLGLAISTKMLTNIFIAYYCIAAFIINIALLWQNKKILRRYM